jgi:hypothetical protein
MIDLTKYAELVNEVLAQGKPCIVATCGPDGMPDLGPKGSVLVFDKDRLAYWERTGGQHFTNVRSGSKVAVLYMNFAAQSYLRFFGTAEMHDSGELRDQVMAKVVQPELDRDPERKGSAVVIRVDKVIEGFGGETLTRE